MSLASVSFRGLKRGMIALAAALGLLTLLMLIFPLVTESATMVVEEPSRLPRPLANVSMELTKAASHDPVDAGALLTYTIAYTVSGTEDATNVIITEVTPLHTTFHTATGGLTLTHPGVGGTGVVTWELGTLQPTGGDPVVDVVTLTVRTDSPLTDGLEIENTAHISDTNGDREASNTLMTKVSSSHSLLITKTAVPDPEKNSGVKPAAPIIYSLNYRIIGNEPAPGVVITDAVPEHTTYVDDSCSPEPCGEIGETGVLSWTVGDKIPTQGGTVGFSVVLDDYIVDEADICNMADIFDDFGQHSRSDLVCHRADSNHSLEVFKEAEPGIVEPGGTIVFTIVYTVAGDEPALGAIITDMVPVHTEFRDCGPKPCVEDEMGVVSLTLGTLTETVGSVTFTVEVDVPLTDGLKLANTAYMSDLSGGWQASNVAEAEISSSHRLNLTKTARRTVDAGAVLTYTIAYTVTGNAPAPGVTITDVVPENTEYAGCEPSADCTWDGQMVTWKLGTLAPSSGVVELLVRVAKQVADGTRIKNVAYIQDVDGKSGAASETTVVRRGPLKVFLPLVLRSFAQPGPTVSKVADRTGVNAGEALAYTIVIRNDGEQMVSAVLEDPIPDKTSFVEGSEEGCAYEAGEGQVAWTGILGIGEPHTCRFSVMVEDAASGDIVNAATVSHVIAKTSQIRTPVMVTNGRFETGNLAGWTTRGELPTTAVAFDGSYRALLGDPSYCNTPSPGVEKDRDAVISQVLQVPAGEGNPKLHFQYRVFTYDHLIWTDSRLGDSLDVYVQNQLALRDNYENLPAPAPGCGDRRDSGWRTPDSIWGGEVHHDVLDLSEWKGQTVEVRFEVWTRHDGYYNTWAYLDDVRVEVSP